MLLRGLLIRTQPAVNGDDGALCPDPCRANEHGRVALWRSVCGGVQQGDCGGRHERDSSAACAECCGMAATSDRAIAEADLTEILHLSEM